MDEYPIKNKRKLAKKIGKIKNKKVLCDIINIIHKRNKFNPKESNRHIFMYFHNFTNDTYLEIEKCVKEYYNTKVKSTTTNDDTIVSTEEYKPYSQEDLQSQKNLSPKLKYSNKERSLLKRRMYNDMVERK